MLPGRRFEQHHVVPLQGRRGVFCRHDDGLNASRAADDPAFGVAFGGYVHQCRYRGDVSEYFVGNDFAGVAGLLAQLFCGQDAEFHDFANGDAGVQRHRVGVDCRRRGEPGAAAVGGQRRRAVPFGAGGGVFPQRHRIRPRLQCGAAVRVSVDEEKDPFNRGRYAERWHGDSFGIDIFCRGEQSRFCPLRPSLRNLLRLPFHFGNDIGRNFCEMEGRKVDVIIYGLNISSFCPSNCSQRL